MSQPSPKKLFKYFSCLLIFLFRCSSILAQQTQPQAKVYKILGISVEGNKSADASTIIANSGLKVGDEIQVPGDQTMNAIKQLWSLNIFSTFRISKLIKRIDDGIFLLIKVDEYPRFEKIVLKVMMKLMKMIF